MRKLYVFIAAVLFIAAFCFCSKRLTKKFRLTGIFIDWFTREPVWGRVTVSARITGGSTYIDLGEFLNETDGTFYQEVPAAKSQEYYIRLYVDAGYRFLQGIKIYDGEIHDCGEVYGSHNFVCKVHLVRTSATHSVQFESGFYLPSTGPADTVYYETKLIGYTKSPPFYPLRYQVLTGSAQQNYVKIPITTSDTLHYEIVY